MARRRTYGMAVAAAAGAVLVATPSSATTTMQVPTAENARYDIQDYRLALGYDRPAGAVDATTTLKLTADTPLRTFRLDFARTVTSATADGEPVTVTEDGDKTIITLSRTLREGETVTLTLTYTVTPAAADAGARFPELKAPDGAVDAAESGLPAGLFPHNVRRDFATFDVASSIPAYLRAEKSENGMRYLDAAAIQQLREAQERAAAAKAAVLEAARQRAAADRAAVADASAERRAAAQERRDAWLARGAAQAGREDRSDRYRDRDDRGRGERGDRGDRGRGEGHGRGEGRSHGEGHGHGHGHGHGR
jgi:hypothetical protein